MGHDGSKRAFNGKKNAVSVDQQSDQWGTAEKFRVWYWEGRLDMYKNLF